MRPVYLADYLFACHSVVRMLEVGGGDFIVTCKETSHKALYDFIDGAEPEPRHLDTRSGHLRLAVIADNSAPSHEAFARNVAPGATLLSDGHASYPGLRDDYRQDPQVVGKIAANIVPPWTHRVFALTKRSALAGIMGCAANTSTSSSSSPPLSPARFVRGTHGASHQPI